MGCFKTAIDIDDANANHFNYISYINIGFVFKDLIQYDQAIIYLKKALNILETCNNCKNSNLVKQLNNHTKRN